MSDIDQLLVYNPTDGKCLRFNIAEGHLFVSDFIPGVSVGWTDLAGAGQADKALFYQVASHTGAVLDVPLLQQIKTSLTSADFASDWGCVFGSRPYFYDPATGELGLGFGPTESPSANIGGGWTTLVDCEKFIFAFSHPKGALFEVGPDGPVQVFESDEFSDWTDVAYVSGQLVFYNRDLAVETPLVVAQITTPAGVNTVATYSRPDIGEWDRVLAAGRTLIFVNLEKGEVAWGSVDRTGYQYQGSDVDAKLTQFQSALLATSVPTTIPNISFPYYTLPPLGAGVCPGCNAPATGGLASTRTLAVALSADNRVTDKTINWMVDPGVDGQLSITSKEFSDLTAAAFQAWSQWLPFNQLAPTSDPAAADIVVGYKGLDPKLRIIGQTFRDEHPTRVFLNSGYMWQAHNTDPKSRSAFHVVLHEIGHALGLDHASDGNGPSTTCVMGPDTGFEQLQDADIEALLSLYGWPPQTRVPAVGTAGTPAIVGFNDTLCMVWRGVPGDDATTSVRRPTGSLGVRRSRFPVPVRRTVPRSRPTASSSGSRGKASRATTGCT